jgi:hypothetical protein
MQVLEKQLIQEIGLLQPEDLKLLGVLLVHVVEVLVHLDKVVILILGVVLVVAATTEVVEHVVLLVVVAQATLVTLD